MPHPDSAIMVCLRRVYVAAPAEARDDIAAAVARLKDGPAPYLDRVSELAAWLARHHPWSAECFVPDLHTMAETVRALALTARADGGDIDRREVTREED
jgi:hypothetical protein